MNGAGANAPVALSPVLLKPDGARRWRGNVDPLQDTFTFYLLVQKQPDGSLGPVLGNPEFDPGRPAKIGAAGARRKALKLIGKRGGKEREVSMEATMRTVK